MKAKWMGAMAALAMASGSLAASEPVTVEATLENGMKVIVRPDRRAPVAVSQVWYRVGGLDEVGVPTGLSHALEHMMFKGTTTVADGEFSRRVAALGGRENAFTSKDYTAYFQQIGASHLPEMFRLEADRMQNLKVDPQSLARELEVIREERRMRTDDNPGAMLMEAMGRHAFAGPSGQPVIGWADDIPRIDAPVLKDWYQRFYAPNNATLVVVGDVDPQAVLNEARATFGRLPARVVARPQAVAEPDLPPGPQRFVLERPSELGYVALGWRVPRLAKPDEPDPYALEVLAAVLDGAAASRLPRALVREQRLADSVSADYDMNGRGEQLFTVVAVPAAGQTPAALEQAVRRQLRQIADKGVEPAELARVRQQLRAGRVYERDSMFAQAMSMGAAESRGHSWRDEDEIDRRLAAVRSEDLQRVVRRYFTDERLVVGELKPLPLTQAQRQAGQASMKENQHVR